MPEYTKVDYLKLHQDILNYQNDKTLSEPIITAFNGFLWKFVDLICHNNFNISDIHLRKFVNLFVTNKYAKTYSNNYQRKPEVRLELIATAEKITYLLSSYTEEDIKNELICTLLHMAQIYKDYDKPSFHNYIDKCFHFRAYSSMSMLIKDLTSRDIWDEYTDDLVLDTTSKIDYEEALNMAQYKVDIETSFFPTSKEKIKNTKDDSFFNINWLNGVTCMDCFKELTLFERFLLKSYYIDNLSDREIGASLGKSRPSVTVKRNEAKSKILKYMENNLSDV